MARKAVIAAAVAIASLLIATQLLLPGIAEHRIEDRLTEGGGEASAAVEAFPAARLIFGHGDSLEVSGTGLDLPLDATENVFGRLDKFDRVDVSLGDFRAGPFEMRSFELRREGSGPYSLASDSTTTAADLLAYGASRLGFAVAPLLGFFGSQAPQGDRPIPIHLDMGLDSDDGRIRVVSGGGTVAGYPAGPLAEAITAAIVVRL